MNSANLVTLSRIALIPVVIACYYSGLAQAHLIAAVIFIIASVTDWLDGYLARKLNQTSAFGAFFDPVADKLLVACILIMLTAVYESLLLATAIIITRELLVSALREWMASQGERDVVKVAFIGKLKTTVQMIAISALLLVSATTPELLWQLGYWLIMLAALLSIWSMIEYFNKARGILFKDS